MTTAFRSSSRKRLALCLLLAVLTCTASASPHKQLNDQRRSGGSSSRSLSSSSSRFDALRNRALSKPTVPDKLRGKTLEDLLSTTGSNSFASDNNGSKTSTHQRRRRQKEWQYSRLAQEEETAPVASPVDDTLEEETAPVASPVDDTLEGETAAEVAEEIDFQNAQTSTPIFFAVYEEFDPLPLTKLGETAGARGLVYDVSAKEFGISEGFVSGAFQATCTVVASTGIQLCTYEIFIVRDEFVGTVVATGSLTLELDKQNLLLIEATGDEYKPYKNGFVGITYIAVGDEYVIDIELLF